MANVSKISDGTTTYNITTEIIKNQNTSGNSLKMWSGTKAQYNALVSGGTIDNNTLYNIIDDTDLSLSILATLYPVGAIYIGTMDTCPLSVLGLGTWVKVSEGRVLQGSDSGHSAGNTIEAGLPNITGNFGAMIPDYHGSKCSGAFYGVTIDNNSHFSWQQGSANGTCYGYDINASRSSSIYGNSSTVQPPAFIVNIWKRIA